MDRAVAIIPARGGSKGLPNKHFLRLGGRTLLGRAFVSAQEATCLHRVLCTTDSPALMMEARTYGVDTISRPPELATDECGMIPVLQHAVKTVEGWGEEYDLIVLLQPTSPFRTGEDIDETLALVQETGADSAQTLVEAYARPFPMVRLRGTHCVPLYPETFGSDLRRQDGPAVYQPSGSVYVTRRDVVLTGRILGHDHRGLVRPWERSLNINTPWDFRIAEMVWERGMKP